ncbi:MULTISPECIES: MlaE family ABC transporter permease [unclassified Nocardioides]|uniref:MlaE family ABC transporter permease n=1 Tax=unclassified Nocardioides TaxID=2615069 RepID=UPI0006F48058|nr:MULTISPECIES: ABC transporter permease [unclassified Nocardioides]KRA28018.1 ABC transporter permease [Nocardioides sp. Root614]KRA85993.1 ABC transporter permease [Nocardioides sp. Root682]
MANQLIERAQRSWRSTYSGLSELGDQVAFYGRSLRSVPYALVHYRKEVMRLLAEVAFGRGALVLVAGTFGIMIFEVLAVGSVVGLVGYQGLRQVGIEPYVGFLSAYFNTREVAPLIASNALVATVGAGFTAQLGAMRISEEIDAVEVMAIPSVPYLVSTRVVAAFIAVIPLYLIGLIGTYAATQAVSIHYYGLTGGTYDHYFTLFLPPIDVLYSFGKVLVFAVILTLVCCYYGYSASGGPAGVGTAVGRAVRMSLVMIVIADFFLSLALWGSTTTVRIAG